MLPERLEFRAMIVSSVCAKESVLMSVVVLLRGSDISSRVGKGTHLSEVEATMETVIGIGRRE